MINREAKASVFDQYIIFCNVLDEQRKLYTDDDRKAVNEAIRICMENGVLASYLQSRCYFTAVGGGYAA